MENPNGLYPLVKNLLFFYFTVMGMFRYRYKDYLFWNLEKRIDFDRSSLLSDPMQWGLSFSLLFWYVILGCVKKVGEVLFMRFWFLGLFPYLKKFDLFEDKVDGFLLFLCNEDLDYWRGGGVSFALHFFFLKSSITFEVKLKPFYL